MDTTSFSVSSMIRRYRIYKDLWDASIGEELFSEREAQNYTDSFAVLVTKDDNCAKTCCNIATCTSFQKLSSSTIVLNSRDIWFPMSENSLTIAFLSNTGHIYLLVRSY